MNKNLKHPLLIFSSALIIAIIFAFGSSHPTNSGMGRTGAPGDGTCLDCHSVPSATINGTVTVTGIPGTVVAGNTYNLTLTATITAGTPNNAGFQVLALKNSNNSNAGTWSNPSSSSSIKMTGGKSYWGHQPKVVFGASNEIIWTADWTAPSSTTDDVITFYAVANLTNGNGSTSGDRSKFTTVTTDIIGTADPLTCVITLDDNISCFGADDGSATVIPDGGVAGYSYLWDNGETNATATMLSPGSHTVTVTDNATTTTTCDITIMEPAILIADAITTDALCFDSNLGTASADVSGGTETYNYLWSNGGSGNIQTDLTAGDYSYTVTDANGCTAEHSFTIGGPMFALEANEIITNATCEGFTDGSATIIATGGSPGYTYYWPDLNLNGATQADLAPGDYNIEITDNNDCLLIHTITIGIETTLVITVESTTSAGCEGEDTGSAVLSATGGTPDYVYNWSDGGTGSTRTDLAAGDYMITCTDQNGCTIVWNITIGSEDTEAPTMATTSFDLQVLADGMVEELTLATLLAAAEDNCEVASVNATIPTYDCSNLGANMLAVDVLDVNGNTATVDLTINIIDAIAPVITCPDNISTNACGAVDYTLPTFTDNCSTLDLQLVSGFESGATFPAGTTVVEYSISDGSGNTSSCTFEVTVNSDLAVDITTTPASCNAATDGSAVFTISGGTPTYTTTIEGDPNLDNLAAGEYNYTILDSGGCNLQGSFVIEEGNALEVTTTVTNVTCFNFNDGSISFEITGGTAPYTINDVETDLINNLEAGSYTYTILDSNNCSTEITVVVEQPDALFISDKTITDASDADAEDGSIFITVVGGTPDYSYVWTLGEDVTVSTAMNLENAGPGTYTCMVTDANGCVFTSLDYTISFSSGVNDEENEIKLNLFPNPSQGHLTIELANINSSFLDVEIYSSNGAILKKASIPVNNGNTNMNLDQLNNGFYFFKAQIDDKVIIKKIFILK